eukprot:jgi/Tetstr1/466572/TSEL_011074.t1
MLEYAVNDVNPSLSFELVEHIAVVVMEHELFSSPSSGKKRRRVTGDSGGSRMLQGNMWDVMEEVPTRHFKFDVTLQEVRRARTRVADATALLLAAQTSSKRMRYPAARSPKDVRKRGFTT